MTIELQEHLNKISKKTHDAFAIISSLTLSQNELIKKIAFIEDSLRETVSVESLKVHLSSSNPFLNEVTRTQKEIGQLKDSCSISFREHRLMINNLENELKKKDTEIEYLKIQIVELKTNLGHLFKDVFMSINEKLKYTKEDYEKQISSLVIPKDTVNMEQVKKEFISAIEPTRLDSRNALLHARNHELKLTILEKKIDNIILELKNKDLDIL